MFRQNYLWIIMIVLLPTLACSIFGGGDDGGNAALDADLAAATAAPTQEAAIEDVDTVAESEQEESETESGAKSEFTGVTGLDDLSAYRVNFMMAFDGESGGQPSKGQIEMMLEVTRDPPARHLQMTMEGTTVEEVGGTNAMDVYSMGDTVYMKNAAMGDNWISFSGGEAESFEQGFFAPDEQLELPDTVSCDSQPETVNGVSATHCRFTEEDVVGESETYESLQGDVWVATDGEYIIKYTLNAQGYRSAEQGEEESFDFENVSFEYNLTDADGDFTINLPEEAQNAGGAGDTTGGDGNGAGASGADAGEIPVMDDAEEVVSMAGFVNYYTSSEVATVVDFYRQELPAVGWKENADQGYSDDTTAILNFEKEGDTATVTVIIEEGRTNVIIAVVEQ